jgi:hypothetical protein
MIYGLLIMLILTGCAEGSNSTATNANTSIQATVSNPANTPIPTASLTQQPTTGVASQNCLSDNPYKVTPSIIGGYANAAGSYPIWLLGFSDTPLSIKIRSNDKPSADGFSLKTLWIIDPHYTEPITIRSGSLTDNTALSFFMSTTSTSISPTNPTIKASQGLETQKGARDFPTTLTIPKPGCYFLETYSSTGQKLWRIEFRAALDLES